MILLRAPSHLPSALNQFRLQFGEGSIRIDRVLGITRLLATVEVRNQRVVVGYVEVAVLVSVIDPAIAPMHLRTRRNVHVKNVLPEVLNAFDVKITGWSELLWVV